MLKTTHKIILHPVDDIQLKVLPAMTPAFALWDLRVLPCDVYLDWIRTGIVLAFPVGFPGSKAI